MATKSHADRLAELQKQKARIDAQIAAEKAKAKKAERSLETRKKVIVGATVLNAIEQDEKLRDTIAKLLAAHVTRDHDRATISDLLPVEKPPTPTT